MTTTYTLTLEQLAEQWSETIASYVRTWTHHEPDGTYVDLRTHKVTLNVSKADEWLPVFVRFRRGGVWFQGKLVRVEAGEATWSVDYA